MTGPTLDTGKLEIKPQVKKSNPMWALDGKCAFSLTKCRARALRETAGREIDWITGLAG